MYCGKCGKEIMDDNTFCSSCGIKIAQVNETIHNVEQTTEKQDVSGLSEEYTEVIKKKKSTKNINAFILLIVIGVIGYFGFGFFWLLLNGEFHVPLFLIVFMIGVGIVAFFGAITSDEHNGKCPYCNMELNIIGEADDCPTCKKRVIVKDSKFYKIK